MQLPRAVYNVLVTGGLRGIGRSIVGMFILHKDNVFVFDCVNSEDKRVVELQQQGVKYIQTDISSLDSIKNGFSKLFSFSNKLDVLVNNAGITRDMFAIRMSEQDWDLVLDVNLKGAFFCSQQALKHMIRESKSYIINISSIAGIVGNPGQVNYAASKAGVIGMTKTLAKEYAARNVIVNAIAPGFIQTQMTEKLSSQFQQQAKKLIPLNRFGVPQDVADLVEFFVSGKADYITGQVIHVDGGMVL